MAKNQKNDILATIKRLVPGTISIGNCEEIEYCMNNNMRSCNDMKNLCVSSRDNERIIGGISFIFGGKGGKNSIVIYRYGQAGYYVNLFEGNGFEEIMEKVDKDETIKDITDRTKFIKDEAKDAEDDNIIEAFKRYVDQSDEEDLCILVTKKDNSGNYNELDNELIKLAKEKEKTGQKIKIIDESEIDKKVYILGIGSIELIKKLELDGNTMMEADNRIHIFVFPTHKNTGFNDAKMQNKYAGILTINSVEDDVTGVDDKKDSLKKYFTEKYKGLSFISAEIFRKKR